ncbi:hypothetical protein ACTZRG_23825, partial [Klebsiella pneumoniae]
QGKPTNKMNLFVSVLCFFVCGGSFFRVPDVFLFGPSTPPPTGQNRAIKSTQYHQQRQHHHRADAH